MFVQCFLERRDANSIHRLNTAETVAVVFTPQRGWYLIQVIRHQEHQIISTAAVKAIREKWLREVGCGKPKTLEMMITSRWLILDRLRPLSSISILIPKKQREEWERFLTELLANPESWFLRGQARKPVGK